MECSKAHKAVSGCTGQLDPTRFVPKGELLTPTGLNRDYNFLQQMSREISLETPDFKRKARDHVRNNVKIRAMPPQMSRAKQNKSGWNRVKKCYIWTVEVKGNETKIVNVPDSTLIKDIVGDIGENACFLIDADTNRIKVDTESTLADTLDGNSVVEFPTLLIAPEDSDSDSTSDSSSDSDSSDSDSSDSDGSDSDASDSDSDSAPEEVSSKEPAAEYTAVDPAPEKELDSNPVEENSIALHELDWFIYLK